MPKSRTTRPAKIINERPGRGVHTTPLGRFERIIADQVFEEKAGRRSTNLTRLEKLFILRCLMERWSINLIASTIKRGYQTVFRYKKKIWEDPRRIFAEVEGLYRIIGRDRRMQMIECTLCQAILRTTEPQMKKHVATHVMPTDLLSNVHFENLPKERKLP